MSAYEDLEEELGYGKRAHEYIQQKDIAVQAAEMTDNCTFVVDWVSEPMPLENKEGNALELTVREMIAGSVYKDAPPTPKDAVPVKEDILVFADQGGFCQRVLEKAPEGRVGTKKIVTKPASLLTADELDALIGSKKWDLVLFGCSLDPPKSNSAADLLSQQDAVVKLLFLLFQTLFRKEGCCKRFLALTNDIFSEEEETHAKRGLGLTTHGYMYGMCNTARLELEFPVMLVDVEMTDAPELLPHVASELFREATFGVNTVRHCYPYPIRKGVCTGRPHGRYVIRQLLSKKYEAAKRPFEIPAAGIIGISGGNGALGLVMGQWLLDTAEKQRLESNGTYQPNFSIQFLSRSMKISDLNMPHWKRIQDKAAAMGIKVEQAALDMGGQEGVNQYISSVSPDLIGFIHSAGVLRDSMLPNQTWEKFCEVFDGKHRAALYVHEALERFSNPNLKFFWLFSSTSVYGNMGQINYSASNSYMDALARHRKALGKPCTAIQWGAWGEVGMAATMDDAMRRRVMMGPMPYFSVKQGLQGLEGGLRTGLPGFSVFIVNPPMMYGMIMGDQSLTQCYSRNFSSEWVSPPGPQTFDKSQTYNMYRMYRYIFSPYLADENSCLVWKKYIRPHVEEKAPEDETVIYTFC